MLINHIKTPNSITLIPSNGKPIIVNKSAANYNEIASLLDNGRYDSVLELVDMASAVKNTNSRFKIKNAKIVLDNEDLPLTLANKVSEFIKNKIDTEPLIKFWNNLKKNPSTESINNLYNFLEANHVPITDDGYFIAYKKINNDFKDIYTNKIDNSIGKIVEVPRSSVNADRNVTCSHGLHVAAYRYAAHDYGSTDDILVEVKVNPRDVVAVPTDYNQQKMRVCKYKVIRVCNAKSEIKQKVYKVKTSKSSKSILKLYGDDRILDSDGNYNITIPNRLLSKLGITINKKYYAYVADKRSRCVTISKFKPKKCVIVHEMMMAHRSSKLSKKLLKAARIHGAKQYCVGAVKGNLEIKL